MTYRVGILADDLTGAAMMAGEFARFGAPVTITDLESNQPDAGCAVWALNLASRNLGSALNEQRVRLGLRRLAEWAPYHIMLKIDSRLRGSPDAFLAPALETQGGLLILQGFDAEEYQRWPGILGAPENHVAQPQALAAADWKALVEARRLATMVSAFPSPGDLIVRDAAQAGMRLWIGSYGLADALAGYLSSLESGPVLVVAGSYNSVTVEQVRHLKDNGVAHLFVDTMGGRSARESRFDYYRNRLTDALALSSAVVISTIPAQAETSHDSAPRLVERPPGRRASRKVAEYVASLVVAAVPPSLAGLVLTGGSTAEAVLRGLGCGALRTSGSEAISGVPLLETECPKYPRLVVATKPGGLGGSADLLRILRIVAGHSSFRGGPGRDGLHANAASSR